MFHTLESVVLFWVETKFSGKCKLVSKCEVFGGKKERNAEETFFVILT